MSGGKQGDAALRSRADELLASARSAAAGGEAKALKAAAEALSLYRELGDELAAARSLQVQAQMHLLAGQPQQSLACADEALDIFLPMQPRAPEEAKAAAIAVEALLQLGQPEAALRTARDAHEAFQEAGLGSCQAEMLEAMASVYGTAGQLAQAERLARRALRYYASQPGNEEAERRVLKAIAAFRLDRGLQPEEARGKAGPAPVNVFAAASDVRTAAEALYALAEVHAAAGRAAEVLEEAKALLPRCQRARDAKAEGVALLAKAAGHLGLGGGSEGLQAAREAKELFEAEGDTHWWALALAMVARAYSEKGQLSMVQQYARSAARKFAEAGQRSREEVSVRLLLVHSLLAVPQGQRRPEDAVREAEDALALARELGDRALQSTTLGAICKARSMGMQYEEALDAANRALTLLEDDDVHGKANLLLHCADVNLVLRRYEEALRPAFEIVALAKKDGDEKFLLLAEQMLQKIERCQGA